MMTPVAACASLHGLTQAIVLQPATYWQSQSRVTLTVTLEYVPDACAFNVDVYLKEGKPDTAAPTIGEVIARLQAPYHELVAA